MHNFPIFVALLEYTVIAVPQILWFFYCVYVTTLHLLLDNKNLVWMMNNKALILIFHLLHNYYLYHNLWLCILRNETMCHIKIMSFLSDFRYS